MLRCLRFYTNFLDNWRVSTERKKHETHIWVCFSTIHQWEEGGKASKGNYILISKNRKHLKLKSPKHPVRPIPPFFYRGRGCNGSFSFLVRACLSVRIHVFTAGQETALFICVCILFVDRSLYASQNKGNVFNYSEFHLGDALSWLPT